MKKEYLYLVAGIVLITLITFGIANSDFSNGLFDFFYGDAVRDIIAGMVKQEALK